MKKISYVLLVASLLIGASVTTQKDVNAASKTTTYKNCTEMHEDYPGGVARSATVKNKGGKTKYKPFVSQALYDANKKSDRDKDLIACER